MNATFVARFDRSYIPEPMSGCWLWVGDYATNTRYGQITSSGGAKERKKFRAHRASWELNRGPIPNGLSVLHKCDTPACVNPDHLFLGTQADNMHDMFAKGRRPTARGERAGKAKLTEEQVLAIRDDPRPYREIAHAYGLGSHSSVKAIKLRRSWAHVP